MIPKKAISHVRCTLTVLLGVLLVCTASACTPSAPKPIRISEEQRFLVHLVRNPGETLPRVAKWYTGSERNSKELQEVNAKIASNGLQVGEALLLPFGSLKTVQPMPKAASARPTKKKGNRGQAVPATPSSTDGIDLLDDLNARALGENTASTQLPPPIPADAPHQAGHEDYDEPLEPIPQSEPLAMRTPSPSLSSDGKTIEDLIREEQAALEQMKNEIGTP